MATRMTDIIDNWLRRQQTTTQSLPLPPEKDTIALQSKGALLASQWARDGIPPWRYAPKRWKPCCIEHARWFT